jgi:hypothetical protein
MYSPIGFPDVNVTKGLSPKTRVLKKISLATKKLVKEAKNKTTKTLNSVVLLRSAHILAK